MDSWDRDGRKYASYMYMQIVHDSWASSEVCVSISLHGVHNAIGPDLYTPSKGIMCPRNVIN